MAVALPLTLCRQNAGMGYAPTLIGDLPIEAFRTVICTHEALKFFKTQSPPGGWFFGTLACGA
jgi:hypothetical protein